jgi:endonuclease YncB( thermonuclease family)
MGNNTLRMALPLVATVLLMACLSGSQVPSTGSGQALKGSGNTGGTTLSCPECQAFPVHRVIDGDTFQSGGETARLYGVDAPEKGEPCYAEATDRLKELAGNLVRVQSGPREEDRYHRMLYYAYTMDGSSIDEMLVHEGLAQAWTGTVSTGMYYWRRNPEPGNRRGGANETTGVQPVRFLVSPMPKPPPRALGTLWGR